MESAGNFDAQYESVLKPLLGAEFHFHTLAVSGIDNTPVFAVNVPEMPLQEICVFHRSVASGDAYVEKLAQLVESAMRERRELPVVRFADGEYAFYDGSLQCNGLYHQAESEAAIRAAIPEHLRDILHLAEHGLLAPLIFPENILRRTGWRSLFGKKRGNDMALRLLALLANNGVRLNGSNYMPFYCVYAYLSSQRFADAVDGKTVCIVNSDFNEEACTAWFARANSHPKLVHVPIPASYVATQWNSMREEAFRHVPENPDCFMVGAGVGALEVCVDAARHFSAPAIDSGHILNVMNDLERKSAGPRLYTYRR